jgi:hypothetical protein
VELWFVVELRHSPTLLSSSNLPMKATWVDGR